MLSSNGSLDTCISGGLSTFLQCAFTAHVQPYIRGAARLPRSRLGAVPRRVSTPCATSDKARYVNKQTLFVRSGSLSRREVVLERMFLMHTAQRQEGAIYE